MTVPALVSSFVKSEWGKLARYLDDGRLEIDNNGAENAIGPFVPGRKNWLYSDSVTGKYEKTGQFPARFSPVCC